MSDTLIPIIILKTVEKEYLGHPYTRCVKGGEHSHLYDLYGSYKPGKDYDISMCTMRRKVEAIIKIRIFQCNFYGTPFFNTFLSLNFFNTPF